MNAGLKRTDQGFIDQLFAILKEEPFRDPMLDSVRSGRMSREGLKVWAGQTVLVVREFTRFISAIHSNCADREAQLQLAENLWEEHGSGAETHDHYALARRLARSLGATDGEIDRTEPLPETTQYIDHCMKLTRESSFVESMAAIGVGIEYFMPKFFGALGAALQEQYGLSPGDVEYLLVHVSADEEHSRRSLEIIERSADSDEVREKAKQALRRTLEVKRKFSEAVYVAAKRRI
jgi:pyrroloquinoline quinone (PQQ) biosynthesis protein C